MIIDITGTELIPGNHGEDCPGNGEHLDENGNRIECCCDECSYMKCCLESHREELCRLCGDYICPKSQRHFPV